MKKIEAIKHIVAYTNKDFIESIVDTTKILEAQGLEVEIQYATLKEVFSAVIIGRRTGENKQKAPIGRTTRK